MAASDDFMRSPKPQSALSSPDVSEIRVAPIDTGSDTQLFCYNCERIREVRVLFLRDCRYWVICLARLFVCCEGLCMICGDQYKLQVLQCPVCGTWLKMKRNKPNIEEVRNFIISSRSNCGI